MKENNVPLSRSRSRKAPRSAGRNGRKKSGAIPPKIAVCGRVGRYEGFGWIHARIQLRRSKYRYLTWYERGVKREFYLGQVKSVPLIEDPAAIADAGPAPPELARGQGYGNEDERGRPGRKDRLIFRHFADPRS